MNFGSLIAAVKASYPGLPTGMAKAYLNMSYNRIADFWDWYELNFEGRLYVLPTYSTGTVEIDSATLTQVDGTSTVWSALSSGYASAYIRFEDEYEIYPISSVDDATTITLVESYKKVGGLAAGSTYTIFKHIYSLPSNVDYLHSIKYLSNGKEIGLDKLDTVDPTRSSVSSYPTHYVPRGVDSSGYFQIELYPIPSTEIVMTYKGKKIVTEMSADSDTPILDSQLILYHALIDLHPVYTKLFPELNVTEVNVAVNNVKNWAALATELRSNLISEDVEKSSMYEQVRDTHGKTSATDPNMYIYTDNITVS